MKITVGGSFHEPGWTSVCATIKKLQDAGHEILAPGIEWEPININDEFVKFKGEENIPIEQLQDGFLSCMRDSDAYVISNPNSYQGFTVSLEFGFAIGCIRSNSSPLKTIYLTNTPLGYNKFDANRSLTYDEFLKNLYTNPSYKNELAYFQKFKGKTDFGYSSERDFYDDLKDMYARIYLLQSQGYLVIGLETLLNQAKNTSQPQKNHSPNNYDEHEL